MHRGGKRVGWKSSELHDQTQGEKLQQISWQQHVASTYTTYEYITSTLPSNFVLISCPHVCQTAAIYHRVPKPTLRRHVNAAEHLRDLSSSTKRSTQICQILTGGKHSCNLNATGKKIYRNCHSELLQALNLVLLLFFF